MLSNQNYKPLSNFCKVFYLTKIRQWLLFKKTKQI
jgi:hypothetical protein